MQLSMLEGYIAVFRNTKYLIEISRMFIEWFPKTIFFNIVDTSYMYLNIEFRNKTTGSLFCDFMLTSAEFWFGHDRGQKIVFHQLFHQVSFWT